MDGRNEKMCGLLHCILKLNPRLKTYKFPNLINVYQCFLIARLITINHPYLLALD